MTHITPSTPATTGTAATPDFRRDKQVDDLRESLANEILARLEADKATERARGTAARLFDRLNRAEDGLRAVQEVANEALGTWGSEGIGNTLLAIVTPLLASEVGE